MDLFGKFSDATDKVNIYNIFGYCYGLNSTEHAKPGDMGMTQVNGKIKTFKKVFTAADYTPWAKHLKSGYGEVPPCVDGEFII